LLGTSYPGSQSENQFNPNGVASLTAVMTFTDGASNVLHLPSVKYDGVLEDSPEQNSKRNFAVEKARIQTMKNDCGRFGRNPVGVERFFGPNPG